MIHRRIEAGSDLTGLSLAAIALALVGLALTAVPSRSSAPPRAVFGSLLSHYCRLWNAAALADNPAPAAPLYSQAAGLVFYGLGESEYRGWNDYAQGVKSALFDKAMSVEFSPAGDVEVERKGGVAWTTALVHVSIVWADGRAQDFDAQQTAVWENQDGRWQIVHEHLSSPALQPTEGGI